VCILLAWEKKHHEKKNRIEKSEGKIISPFFSLFAPEKIVIFKLSSKFSWINELLH